jgi:hypothetical protein
MNCIAITKSKRTPCTRKAVVGTQYCWQHKNTEEKTETEGKNEVEVKTNIEVKVDTKARTKRKTNTETEVKIDINTISELDNTTGINIKRFAFSSIYVVRYLGIILDLAVNVENETLAIICNNCITLPPITGFANINFIMLPYLTTIPPLNGTKYLHIEMCSSLTTFYSIDSLESLKILNCNKIWSLPPLPQLFQLHAEDCKELTYVPSYPQLTNCKLRSCNLDQFQECKNLENLLICNNTIFKIPHLPKLRTICACGNPITEVGYLPNLEQPDLIKVLEIATISNHNFGNPVKSEIEGWLIENSINKEDFIGDPLDLSKGWITIKNDIGYYTYPSTELIQTFSASENSYIMTRSDKGFVHDYSKRIFKEPYTGNWILIPQLQMLCIFSNFKLQKLGKFQIISGECDIYELIPISISILKGEGTWCLDDVNKTTIHTPGILKCDDGIYMGNLKEGIPDGWGFKINAGVLKYGNWDNGVLLG